MYFMFIATVLSFLQLGDIEIKNAWVRPGSQGSNTALFFDIVNHGSNPDTLFDAESDLAKITEVHETFETDGMMGMRRANFVVIDANSTFSLKPRAHHVMLIILKDDLKPGKNVDIILNFKTAGKIKVNCPVKEMLKKN